MMVRSLGQCGPKVCAIINLPQLKQSSTCLFEKRKRKKIPKERHPHCSHLRATEPGYCRVYTPLGVQGQEWVCVSLRRPGVEGLVL